MSKWRVPHWASIPASLLTNFWPDHHVLMSGMHNDPSLIHLSNDCNLPHHGWDQVKARIHTQSASQSHFYCFLRDLWILKFGYGLQSPTYASFNCSCISGHQWMCALTHFEDFCFESTSLLLHCYALFSLWGKNGGHCFFSFFFFFSLSQNMVTFWLAKVFRWKAACNPLFKPDTT